MSDWSLRLFAGADIVGSTGFKSSVERQLTPSWAATFEHYVQEFPPLIGQAYESLPEAILPCEKRLSIWKFLGDEFLFTAQLLDYRHALTHVWVLKEAVNRFNELWRQQQLPLRLKATAWVAGFPVINREIRFQTKLGEQRDFVGPSIDAGFRISKFSTAKRFVVSAELALLLLDTLLATPQVEPCRLMYHGREVLRGVVRGKPYPIVWIDMQDGELTLEEELLGISAQPKHHTLRSFLADFLDQTPGIHPPFLITNDGGNAGDGGSDTGGYGTLPPGFEVELAKLKQKPPTSVDG